MIVAIKAITKKDILRSSLVDLLDNEITVQSHLKSSFCELSTVVTRI